MCLIVFAGASLACGGTAEEKSRRSGGHSASGGSPAGAGSGGARGGEPGGGTAGVPPLDGPLDGSYTLTFDDVEYTRTPTAMHTFQSLGKSMLVSLREEAGVTGALVSTKTTIIGRYLQASASAAEITLDDTAGVPFGADGRTERWTQLVLGRRSNGSLDGTFQATGQQTYTPAVPGGGFLEQYDVAGSGHVTRDTEPPGLDFSAATPAMPWTPFRMGFDEPVSRSELEALEVTLPYSLGAMALREFVEPTVDPMFGSAQSATFRLPTEHAWADLSGTVVLDARSVHDLAGLGTANPHHSIVVSQVGPAQPSHDMASLTGLVVDGGAALTTAGSTGETLCQALGCVVLGCGARVFGLLEVGAAASLTIRHRAGGQGARILDPGGFQFPGVSLLLTRRGGETQNQSFPLVGDNFSGVLDEAWHDDVVPLPAGTTGEVGFELSAACATGASVVWVVDAIAVAAN